jgi:hypothetical protein
MTFSDLLGGVSESMPPLTPPSKEIRFKKTVLDSRFVAEGVAVADVNRDGRLDVLAGNVWYEAPHWTPHEIAPFQKVVPATGYSNCFNTWAADLNHDGWVDQIVIGMPGERTYWRENPRGGHGPWAEHPIWPSACDESPLYADLLRNGRHVLVMGFNDDYLAWFEPSKDPYAEWQCHIVSEKKGPGSQGYTHGLGVGDINADGRNEILTHEGYYVQPDDPRQAPWTFVRANLGPDCAQMEVVDLHRGRPSLISTSAHNRGVWWYEQVDDGAFTQHVIDETISETHSMSVAPLNRHLNVITGKRVWAHGPHGDVGANEPAWLVRYEMVRKGKAVEWVRHIIDEDSGVGTQFVIQDVNHDGLLDIVIANKKGVFLFEQQRT